MDFNTIYNVTDLLYDFCVENEIATREEICLVCDINGTSEKTYNDIIWCRTEYHDVPQIYACEPERYHFDNDLLKCYGLIDDDEEEE